MNKLCELLLLCSAATGAQADPAQILGEWRGIAGPEHIIFSADGVVRTCYGARLKGNAALGYWQEVQPGRFKVAFTHAVSPDCAAPPQTIRKYQVEILGYATATVSARARGPEVALFVSGEGPPDRYARVPPKPPQP